MTKIATMPIDGKKLLKIFFSETSRPITFELGTKHWGPGPYKVCSNNDPGLTLTYFMARSTLLSNALVLENAKFKILLTLLKPMSRNLVTNT